MEQPPRERAALHGLRVVELGHMLPGPFAGTLLADLGAEVIHVEHPVSGDHLRRMGPDVDGEYLLWRVSARNKRSLALDINQADDLVRLLELIDSADIVITNLRPSVLERAGLSWESLHVRNRRLIMLQVSGFGATTSAKDRPGYGRIAEARSGAVHLTGLPDGAPLHAGFSLGDSTTGLMGAFAILAAAYRRETDVNFAGEWIDLAMEEGLFRMIEMQLVVFDRTGRSLSREGNRLPGGVNSVQCTLPAHDGRWVTVSAGTVAHIAALAHLVGMDADDIATRDDVALRQEDLIARLASWAETHRSDEVVAAIAGVGAAAAVVLDARGILDDPLFAERGDVVTVADDQLGALRMAGVVPRLACHPGGVWSPAPALGECSWDELFESGTHGRSRSDPRRPPGAAPGGPPPPATTTSRD